MDRGKRKITTKQQVRRGRGRGSSSGVFFGDDRAARQQYIQQEEMLQQAGFTISPIGCPSTPLHIIEFDDSYMRDSTDEFELKAPNDTVDHPLINYAASWKAVEEAREMDPYAHSKISGVDYRFWNVFHSNFYATAILPARKGKICEMHFIDFDAMQAKEEPDFDAAIKVCDKFELSTLMSFKYDWNREILAQFHATYFWNRDNDEVHWMTDGTHYRIDFITFCRILGFGNDHRTYSRIHNERRFEPHEVSFMWEDPTQVNNRRTGLKSFYYVMNNLIKMTLNPKDNATDLNGHITNVLSRFPEGDKFNIPRFIWVELAYAMDDGRRSLPYAPYLMFMIERVTGVRYPKDCSHTVYNIKKTKGGKTAPPPAVESSYHSEGGHSVPQRRDGRKKKRFQKLAEWVKAIFGTCSYMAQNQYDDRMESRHAINAAREVQGLPLLPPVAPPPQFPDLPHLSDTESDEEHDSYDEHQGYDDDPDLQETLGSVYRQFRDDARQRRASTSAAAPRRSTRASRFTATTHRAGRAVVSSDNDDDDE